LSKKEISICRKKKLQTENPYPFAWKELAYFYAPFSLSPGLVSLRKNKTGLRYTPLQKGKHFPFALRLN
jgi:hypothetical protein